MVAGCRDPHHIGQAGHGRWRDARRAGAVTELPGAIGTPCIHHTALRQRERMQAPSRDRDYVAERADDDRGVPIERRAVAQLPARVVAPAPHETAAVDGDRVVHPRRDVPRARQHQHARATSLYGAVAELAVPVATGGPDAASGVTNHGVGCTTAREVIRIRGRRHAPYRYDDERHEHTSKTGETHAHLDRGTDRGRHAEGGGQEERRGHGAPTAGAVTGCKSCAERVAS